MLQEDVEDYDVVIAGGGIGGLTLACGLAANGCTTCVLESRPSVVRSKRGLALQPNGLAALDDLGLLTQVLGIGKRTNRVAWWEIGNGQLATFDYSILDHPHNFLLTIIPSELETILREELSRRGGVLHESTSFLGVKHEPNGQLRVTALRSGEAIEYSARILVGADGENSNCRKALGVRTRVKESVNQYLFMLIGPVDAIRQEARQYFTRGKMVGFYPTLASTYVFYYLPKRKFNDLRSAGLESFKRELREIEPEVSDSLDNLHSWEDVSHAAPKRVDVENWVLDRAALMGDAVHALDPAWAQGANLSLQDAVALADTVERCFESDDFSASALRPYQLERWKQTKFVQDQSERTAQITTTENRFYYWLGKRLIRNTGADPGLMKIALSASSGLTNHISMRDRIRFLI